MPSVPPYHRQWRKKARRKVVVRRKMGGRIRERKACKKGSSDDSLPKILPAHGPPLEPLPPPPRLPTPAEYVESARRRCSVGSMQSSTLIRPSPNYRPRPAWVSRPPSMQTHFEVQSKAREERGIERTDFGEMRSPFQLQLLARAQALEVTDA
ncbi:uncharacterized protein LOC135342716 isoform X2 [Halichondria panicea]|uniref:uncharacterized protein LOC135342716 isoform X2 n=1 Tax=Halichondria panicea TaxID=6063 RepID=UPI00312B44EB